MMQTETMASLFEALSNVRRLWDVLSVGQAPDDKQLALWMGQFSEKELIYAFTRVGKKFVGRNEPEASYRYTTSILLAEHRKAQPEKLPS